jgi:thioredoxin-related protein
MTRFPGIPWSPPRFARALTLAVALLMGTSASAAELVMFTRAGCPYCAQFDREIAPIYQKTDEGNAAPLRRVDINAPIPADLSAVMVERITPVFVLVDQGHEIGRIRGYPGEDNFWGLLAGLIGDLQRTDTDKVN